MKGLLERWTSVGLEHGIIPIAAAEGACDSAIAGAWLAGFIEAITQMRDWASATQRPEIAHGCQAVIDDLNNERRLVTRTR